MPDDAARFCAQFRRVNPLPKGEVVTILDGVRGRGQYVGTYCAWGVNNSGWWGEGEVKFFLDGDGEFPTICGTGTEDYFCGSYNFDVDGQYTEFTTPYAGMPQVLRPDGTYRSQQRFGLYRWHLTDPIRFRTDLRVTMQALGWRRGRRYLQLQDDIATVAYWYQTLPLAPFPPLPGPRRPRDHLESGAARTARRERHGRQRARAAPVPSGSRAEQPVTARYRGSSLLVSRGQSARDLPLAVVGARARAGAAARAAAGVAVGRPSRGRCRPGWRATPTTPARRRTRAPARPGALAHGLGELADLLGQPGHRRRDPRRRSWWP